MNHESVKDFYNRQYTFHRDQQIPCPNAMHDLSKAHRRVTGVIRSFGIEDQVAKAKVLDVGCGPGYYTKALADTGAEVVGIDFSEAAIAHARSNFPDCRFDQASWPDDIAGSYDLIWMVNFSLMNTFDVNFIDTRLVGESIARLNPGGRLIVGWNSDFSGRALDGYSHWPIRMLRDLRKISDLSAPIVVEMKTAWLSWLVIRAAYVTSRSIPIFMMLRKEGEVPVSRANSRARRSHE